MNIDYNKIKDEAKRSGLSPFLLMRRKIGYGRNVNKGMCKNCEFVAIPKIKDKHRMQCIIIGIGDDFYADVNPVFCCKKAFILREENLKVISDFMKNYYKE